MRFPFIPFLVRMDIFQISLLLYFASDIHCKGYHEQPLTPILQPQHCWFNTSAKHLIPPSFKLGLPPCLRTQKQNGQLPWLCIGRVGFGLALIRVCICFWHLIKGKWCKEMTSSVLVSHAGRISMGINQWAYQDLLSQRHAKAVRKWIFQLKHYQGQIS